MKVWISPYQLIAKKSLNAQSLNSIQGVLLRVDFDDQTTGYSCLQAWEGLGDQPLFVHLESIKSQKWTFLAKQAIEIAKQDACAREKRVSLFEGFQPIKSHWTCLSLEDFFNDAFSKKEEGFDVVKLKLSSHLMSDLRRLFERNTFGFRFRFDLNLSLQKEEIEHFDIKDLSLWKKQIDLIEDPMPFESLSWEKLANCFGSLGFDRISIEEVKDQKKDWIKRSKIVFKPMIQKYSKMISLAKQFQVPILVTSNMDHVFGQMVSYYYALLLKKNFSPFYFDCGVITHLLFEENEFSSELKIKNGKLLFPNGFGFGFDQQLKQQNWEKLI